MYRALYIEALYIYMYVYVSIKLIISGDLFFTNLIRK